MEVSEGQLALRLPGQPLPEQGALRLARRQVVLLARDLAAGWLAQTFSLAFRSEDNLAHGQRLQARVLVWKL